GLIGMGNIGKHHYNILQGKKISRCVLTAICDNHPERLVPYQDTGLKLFNESSALIHSGEVDAVIIGTPHYSHTSIGIEALKKGLHTLVEKPISVHKADCERLIAAHKDKSRVFAVMFNQRTDPHYQEIRKMILNGDLGPLQRASWIITEWFRPEVYYASGTWRATWKGEGGGALLNQCPHTLDMWQWLLGMPIRMRAFCSFGKYHKIEVEDEVTAYMEYENGATGIFIGSTGETPGSNRLEIAGDKGKLVYEHNKILFTRNETPTSVFNKTTKEAFGRPKAETIEIHVEGNGGQHAEVIQRFVDAILDGAPLLSRGEEGLASVELANAMIYSSVMNRTIDIPIDSAEYEKLLNKLIAESKFVKQTAESEKTDMSKSFLR
ncbi:Gfo/Idh/MocA family oxidoreductase, partial [Candidatus Sumerlaeota bacterium]|nr:Gfo/Idh/MocA family oxidoreductase [Candidatus Sumerlaeota bacterium]